MMDPLAILLFRHEMSVQAIQAENRAAERMIRRIQLSELEAAILDVAAKLDRLNEVPPGFGAIHPEREIVHYLSVCLNFRRGPTA